MAPEVLYRKYRPQNFKDVVGQEAIVSALKQEIADKATAHAYLFCGARGTGKTSVARIMARELGCSPKDLYEIDAASNTSVDDVRELRDGVRSLPFESDVKVYIIDEVHMLSKSAFNALLKTLEEPPAHVIFILATTELHKVPETVISRCELHSFKQPTVETLAEVVTKVSKKEGYKIDKSGARLVASLGAGSFRDTLGVLQKVLSGVKSSEEVTAEDVRLLMGEPADNLVIDFLDALLSASAGTALAVVKNISDHSGNIKIFTRRVLDDLRFVMLIKYAPDMKAVIKTSVREEIFNKLETLSNHDNSNKISAVLKELLDAYDAIGTTYLSELPLELAIVNICEKLGVKK